MSGEPFFTNSRSQNEVFQVSLAEAVVEYLRSRFHTEAPHISILSPEHAIVLRAGVFKQTPTIEEVEEEDTLELEALEERLDPLKTRGQSTHGIQATFEGFNEGSAIKMHTTFYIRVAPPVEFRKVDIFIVVNGKREITAKLVVKDEHEEKEWTSGKTIKISKFPLRVILAFGWPDVVTEVAKIVSKALYPGAVIEEFTDEATIEALSTARHTKSGKIFEFSPTPENVKNASSDKYYAVQNFLYEIELSEQKSGNLVVTFVLRYVAPVLIDREKKKVVRVKGYLGYPAYVYCDDVRDRWSVHHIFEVESELTWQNTRLAMSWTDTKDQPYPGLRGVVPIGALVVFDEERNLNRNCILIRDWHVVQEEIYPVEESDRTIEESFRSVYARLVSYLESSGCTIDKRSLEEAFNIVLQAVKNALRIERLYKFQEEALLDGLKFLLEGKHKAIVLQARTAGGKTLAFLLPILIYILFIKLSRESSQAKGVKALLMYPTVALQNDQAGIVFKVLWHINKVLAERYGGLDLENRTISLGILHGHVPSISKMVSKDTAGKAQMLELRMRCPLCDSRLVLVIEAVKESKVLRERVKCSELDCQLNDQNSAEYRLINAIIRGSRDAIYSDPPDILITNPDIINARLTLAGKEDPASLAIFGKSVYMCLDCRTLHDTVSEPSKCEECGSRNIRKIEFSHPQIIVIDEAHLMRGAFGAQVSYVLTVLEEAIRRLKGLPKNWRPIYFVSSATLNNPVERVCELIAISRCDVVVKSANLKGREKPTLRIHVFIMPKLYSPEATTVRIIEALYSKGVSALADEYKPLFNRRLEELKNVAFKDGKPATLVFVNRIAEANELLNFIRSSVPNINSDGHTTDYASDRVKVEDAFSRGELDIIVATSGLEVGVDFDRVDVGIIYGMPFYVSDYTQRIGRIGRKHHCIIFNVFMPDKPLDHFYYRNWSLLSDGALREAMIRAEAYRISRENPEAVRRAIKRAIMTYVSTYPGAGDLITNTPLPGEIDKLTKNLGEHLEDYLRSALRVENLDKHILEEASQFVSDLRQEILDQSTRTVFRSMLIREQLHTLRSLDFQVEYDFGDEKRYRELSYAFRHTLPGQIISYRGIFYVIKSYSSAPLYTTSTGERR